MYVCVSVLVSKALLGEHSIREPHSHVPSQVRYTS